MTSEIIAFPDAEGVLVNFLNGVLDVPVSTRVPSPRPASFVRVVRVGGSRRDLVTDGPLLVFEAWAATETAAADLARLARAYVGSLPGQSVNGVWVYRVVEAGGTQSFPDPATDSPRYQFTVQIYTRGAVL